MTDAISRNYFVLSEKSERVLFSQLGFVDLNVEKLDFLNISVSELSKYDCVFSVQLDYMFSAEEIKLFFEKCSSAGVNICFVSTQLSGPLNFLKAICLRGYRDRRLKKHGYFRSLGWFKRLASDTGFNFSCTRGISDDTSGYYFLSFDQDKEKIRKV